MPYKEESKAREASRERMRKHRQGVTGEDVTPTGNVTPDVTPKLNKWGAPVNPPAYVDPATVEPEYRRIIIDLGLGDIYVKPEGRRQIIGGIYQ